MKSFFFNPETLAATAAAFQDQYRDAEPFPHCVIDGIVPDDVLDSVAFEFPSAPQMELGYDTRNDYKSASQDINRWGPNTRLLMAELNSAPFLTFITQLTGIPRLISDPYYDGGGLHQTVRGGKLGIHADFNKHSILGIDRRVNVILYLNRDWDPSWGGDLELWDKSMRSKVGTVTPAFGRCLVFNTNDFSFHGHPEPLDCPPGQSRRSLALYYYSNGRPLSDLAGESHGTQFRRRPGTADLTVAQRSKLMAREILPPVLFRRIQRMRGYDS